MMPILKRIRRAVKCVVAALPVPYRTTRRQPSLMSLTDPYCGNARAFPTGLDPFLCTTREKANSPRSLRSRHPLSGKSAAALARITSVLWQRALGRPPESCKYSADMSKHAYFALDKKIRHIQREYRAKL